MLFFEFLLKTNNIYEKWIIKLEVLGSEGGDGYIVLPELRFTT
jgi:hypothetical protein